MSIKFHKGDLPSGLSWGSSVAVDTETLGLSLVRDKLCVVQLSAGMAAHMWFSSTAILMTRRT